MPSEKITLTTQDDVSIVGNYFAQDKEDAPAVILLHMMPSTKESWDVFAGKLQQAGFQVLAIDERGHGESIRAVREGEAVELDYKTFAREEQQAKRLDVEAGHFFFVEKGVEPEDIVVGGASIGANLTLLYLAEHKAARAGIVLSPGYNYRGIETLPLIERTYEGQQIFLAAAKDDSAVPDSADAVEELAERANAKVRMQIFETGGHGTDIFGVHPEFMDEIVEWLVGAL